MGHLQLLLQALKFEMIVQSNKQQDFQLLNAQSRTVALSQAWKMWAHRMNFQKEEQLMLSYAISHRKILWMIKKVFCRFAYLPQI